MSSEPEMFEALYRATRADLLAYALRRSANAEDAADVLSETYLTAWRKLEEIPSGDDARLWLFGVARNVLRRSADRHRSSDALAQRLASELRNAPLAEPVAYADPTIRTLRAGLASLGARDREIVTLTAWEGLTPRQIAAVMDMPTNLVRARLHRVRSRLRARVTEAQLTEPRPRAMIVEREG
jgi:RNA polymerase sigma factor (sigma-70 family)